MFLLQNIQLESLLLYKLFSNFKLPKHQKILVCCFRYRIRINDKIVDSVVLYLAFTIASLLPLATSTPVCFTRKYYIY